MDADLPARPVGPRDRFPERVLGLPVEGAGELATWAIRCREAGRPAGQGAVGVELHRPDREEVVAERPRQSERLELVELRGDRHRGHPDAEQAALASRPVAVHLAPCDLRVDDRGDARGQRARTGPALDVADDLLERRVVVEPGTVVADVDGGRDHELLCGVEEVAGRPTAIVPDEASSLRVGRVVGQATDLQPEAVREGMVAAHVLHEDRVDTRRLVEVPAGRQPAVPEHLRVHSDRADPRPVGRALRGFGDALDEIGDGGDSRIADVDGGELCAREREMVVCVDEARQDRSPADIDPARVRWSGRKDASSAPTPTIRSPTIAMPPGNGGSPERAVNTRPLSRTRPGIADIFPPSGAGKPRWSSLAPRSTMQAAGWRTPLAQASVAALTGGPSMRRWTTVAALFAAIAIIAGCTGGGHGNRIGRIPGRREPTGGREPTRRQRRRQRFRGSSEACNPPRQEGVTLTFVSFGGVYQEAQRKAWLEPYTELTGVQFVEDENSSNATIKAQVESGQVTWDVVDVGNDFGLEANSDLLEPLDYSLIPRDEMNQDLGVSDWRVPDITYGVVLAYNTEQTAGVVPEGWADYFDTTKIPGKRGAWDYSEGGMFEFALMADGVAPDELYPLDLDAC